MLQPRLRCLPAANEPSLNFLAASLNTLSLCPKHARLAALRPTSFIRHASHAAQGRANGPKDTAGRRLGAKKTATQYVIPGNIIFKQRGTKWHPGENVGLGKDHTIYATEYGYVRYYKDPARHPKRRYIGVALEREGRLSVLPTPQNATTRRRLGMYASPITSGNHEAAFLQSHLSSNSEGVTPEPNSERGLGAALPPSSKQPAPVHAEVHSPVMRQGTYMQREANFEIGRAAEKRGINVREYDRGDRWLAWRKRAQKVKKAALARATKASRKTKGKKVNKAGAGGPGRKR